MPCSADHNTSYPYLAAIAVQFLRRTLPSVYGILLHFDWLLFISVFAVCLCLDLLSAVRQYVVVIISFAEKN